MPQEVVVHLHAIDVLSYLVREDCDILLKDMLESSNHAIVGYSKPGSDLAKSVFEAIKLNSQIDTIFLMNHGIVIGGHSACDVQDKLDKLLEKIASKNSNPSIYPINFDKNQKEIASLREYEYVPTPLTKFNNLVTNPDLLDLVENKWALFPDHVVFLGAKAVTATASILIKFLNKNEDIRPPFIFCKNIGVFQHNDVTNAQLDQLSCFYDVAIRQDNNAKVVGLTDQNIDDLLNWDAEKYRLSITK
jgi:rhamnose utilization protein RhaD (predicted bifunctional aldolase and dehydrogenase)